MSPRPSKLVFLALTAIFLNGCMETTTTQRNYTTARDECREMSESAAPQQPQAEGEQRIKNKRELLSRFSECMTKKGWAVTGPDKNKKKPDDENIIETSVAPPMRVVAAPLPPPSTSADELRLKRAAECAYARQAEYHSSNARALAKSCELECLSQRKRSPNATLPAACAK